MTDNLIDDVDLRTSGVFFEAFDQFVEDFVVGIFVDDRFALLFVSAS